MNAEQFVSIQEAARFLGVPKSYVYEKVRLGRLPSYKLGGLRRFRLSELAAWMEARREGADRPVQKQSVTA
jgi:excisionase family DNA binding protein